MPIQITRIKIVEVLTNISQTFNSISGLEIPLWMQMEEQEGHQIISHSNSQTKEFQA
jgi:hypothetical protein